MPRHDLEPVRASDIARVSDARVVGDPDAVFTGITQDSREVRPGDVFCCVRGAHTDGHLHARDAVAAGAVVLVCDTELSDDDLGGARDRVTQVVVDDVRRRLGVVAAEAFGHPARSLRLVGVTGTNGKTSTVAILASILESAGSRTAVFGTLTGARTTPEAIDLHAGLRAAVADGVETVVMEVSSHALVLGRVEGLVFEVAVFTNLSRDHLDFHGDMETYFGAKAMLFSAGRCSRAVVNADDPHGRRILEGAEVPVVAYSPSAVEDPTYGHESVSFTHRGHRVQVPIGGRFTVANALAAITAAESLGVSIGSIVDGCARVVPPVGRFQVVPNDLDIAVVVDYAHTPEGLEILLRSAREVCAGRVIVVFGCGGGRDRGKRASMGEVAGRGADVVVVTSDNPRDEDPMEIIGEVAAGVRAAGAEPVVESDRALAIGSAISAAERGDMVVIAGKGHETTQETAGVHRRFVDAEVAAAALGSANSAHSETRKGGVA